MTTLPPFSADEQPQLLRRQRRIERDARAGFRQGDQVGLKRRWRPQVGELGEVGLRRDRQLALVDEHHVLAVRGEDGEAERKRRMRYVAATDIEGPGERRRIRQDRVRCALPGDVGGQPRQLVLGEFAGKLDWMDFHGLERRFRLSGPQLVDRVVFDRDEFGLLLLKGRTSMP